jgi:hypothetical protein
LKLPHWLKASACGAIAALSVGCSDILYAEGDIPEVCVTEANTSFPGVPVDGTQTVKQDLSYDIGSIDILTDDKNGVEAQAKLLSLTLTASDNTTDLGFIDHLKATVAAPAGSNLPPLTVIDYTKPAGAQATKAIAFKSDSTDVIPYFVDGNLNLSLEITGDVPQTDWSVDAQGCLSVKGKVKYLKAMKNQ